MASLPSFWRRTGCAWLKLFRPARGKTKPGSGFALRRLRMERLEGRAMLSVTVTANTANLAANASSIVIAGTGFDPIVANDSVAFTNGNGTVTGTVTAASPTSLTVAISPTSQMMGGELDAVVTADGTASASAQVATCCAGHHQRHGQPGRQRRLDRHQRLWF